MFNMQQMMQKAQTMQKKMAALQEELSGVEVEGQSGGGMVRVVMTCKGQMRDLMIDPSIINASEKDMLEDLIQLAHNDAKDKADAAMADAMGDITGGLKLPGGMKLPF